MLCNNVLFFFDVTGGKFGPSPYGLTQIWAPCAILAWGKALPTSKSPCKSNPLRPYKVSTSQSLFLSMRLMSLDLSLKNKIARLLLAIEFIFYSIYILMSILIARIKDKNAYRKVLFLFAEGVPPYF